MADLLGMNEETRQRLKNLALFRVWMTDRQLSRYWPIAAALALIILSIAAVRYFLVP